MTMLLGKSLALFLRFICKSYEYILRGLTRIIRGRDIDPSKILIDYYTDSQKIAQIEIDNVIGDYDKLISEELLIIIPFKDKWDLTKCCLDSLERQTIAQRGQIRVVLVDNGSSDSVTIEGLRGAKERYPALKIELLRADYEFNFSRLNNHAFQAFASAVTKTVLFLNNDVELLNEEILMNMVQSLNSLPKVGVMGCTLLYPDRTIQHLFVAPGVKIIASHPLKGVPWRPDLLWFSKKIRPVAAVTGALMLLRAQDFRSAGGFDESLPTLGQDVTLCLKINRELGRYNVVYNAPAAIHHESMTKATKFPLKEINYAYTNYGDDLNHDMFFNRKFSRWSERLILAPSWEPKYPTKAIAAWWQ
jgi:GT2 family glycosyltransferase